MQQFNRIAHCILTMLVIAASQPLVIGADAGPIACGTFVTTCCVTTNFWMPILIPSCLSCSAHCVPGVVLPVPGDVTSPQCCVPAIALSVVPTP
jgi:hypothetical protein